MSESAKKDIDHLNSFLRGEISAVETYRQAIGSLNAESEAVQTQLNDCLASHKRRTTLLTQEIRRLGGTPETKSGLWGSFAKLIEGGAAALGLKAAVAVLEEGEDHGRNDYARDAKDLSQRVRDFIMTRIVPEQTMTHSAMSSLKRAV
jgi:demethoxyubiquinone hydroxylase (CLK1/Coq7/Cat5 family)